MSGTAHVKWFTCVHILNAHATRWVVDHMLSLGFSKSLSEWIGSNLKKDNDHVTWAFDLQAAIDMFSSYR